MAKSSTGAASSTGVPSNESTNKIASRNNQCTRNQKIPNQSKQKSIELGNDASSSENAADRSTNATNTTNLEYLPSEILLDLFTRMECIELMNLAETSYRFAGIAQRVFIKGDKYFVGVSHCGDPELYRTQLNRSGDCIKAIRFTNIRYDD